MTSIPKIDIHAHAIPWPAYSPRYRHGVTMLSPEELFQQYYDRLNIEKGLLLPLPSPEAQLTPITSEMVKYLADRHPDRFLWFCNVDPRAMSNSPRADLGYRLEHYKALGACGVGEVTANLYADDPMMENLFSTCADLGLPVTIHIAPGFGDGYGIVDELGLPRLSKMLKKYPDLIIFGHSQPFWSEIGENNDEIRNTYVKGKVQNGALANLLREHPNLYCDLSAGSGANALMRDREHAARFIEEFSDRLLYGCDICMPQQGFPFAFDEFLTDMRCHGEISEANYRKLVRENACRILHLS